MLFGPSSNYILKKGALLQNLYKGLTGCYIARKNSLIDATMSHRTENKGANITKYAELIRQKYDENLQANDPNTLEAIYSRGEDKTRLRYKILCEIDNLSNKRVLDFGCGTGMFASYLKENEIKCDYYGWDISQEMIKVARKRLPDLDWRTVDILTDDTSEFNNFFDYVIVCGVLNLHFDLQVSNVKETHERFITNLLLKLWPLCKTGIAVNFLSEFVDWEDDGLYYCSLNKIISFVAQHLSKYFTIRDDYELYEFTLYLFKYPKYGL